MKQLIGRRWLAPDPVYFRIALDHGCRVPTCSIHGFIYYLLFLFFLVLHVSFGVTCTLGAYLGYRNRGRERVARGFHAQLPVRRRRDVQIGGALGMRADYGAVRLATQEVVVDEDFMIVCHDVGDIPSGDPGRTPLQTIVVGAIAN